MLHCKTAAVVVASLLTGSLLTIAGATALPTVGTDPTPTPVTTTEGAAPTIGDPWAWTACVETTYNMGGGSDADMARCDRLYPVADTVRAECEFSAEEGGQDWPADVTAQCGWTEGEPLPGVTPDTESHGGNLTPETPAAAPTRKPSPRPSVTPSVTPDVTPSVTPSVTPDYFDPNDVEETPPSTEGCPEPTPGNYDDHDEPRCNPES